MTGLRHTHAGAASARRKRAARPAVRALEPRTLLAAWDVLSYHDDPASTGRQLAETVLTPQNVGVSTFGKQFTTSLDGQVYAQPLVKGGVRVTAGDEPGLHDVVVVATEHDSVYALDAHSGDVLWKTSFLDPAGGVTSVPAPDDVNTGDLTPEIGITGTPVIDPGTGLVYVLAKTKHVIAGDTSDPHYVQTLHALDIATGSESAAGPAVVADTTYHRNTNSYTFNSGPFVFGTGDGAVGGRVDYNALREHQRAALTLVNGTVYLASASHGDNGPYHGWVLGYDARTLAITAAFNTTPNGGLGGIWQAGGQVASDPQGNLYVETGNGTFGDGSAAPPLDANGFPVGGNYGDSFLKLSVDPTTSPARQNVNGWGLKVSDYFTPYNQLALSNADADLGSAAPLILPDAAGAALGTGQRQHLLVGSGKEGRIYLIDRDHMGKFDPNTDHVTQEVPGALSGALDTAAYFNGTLYYVQGYGGVAKAFSLADGVLGASPTSRSADSFSFAGATPTVSADGARNAIVWTVERGTNQLRAYDAADLGNELWNSSQAAGGRDRLGSAVKFEVPTVADGMVFVGTTNALVGYGLLLPPTSVPAAPSGLSASAVSGSQVQLGWKDNADNESGFAVEGSTDGVHFSTLATPPANTRAWLVGGLLPHTAYTFRVEATNALGASPPSNPASATTQALSGGLDFSAGFAAAAGALTLNGSAAIAGSALQLTDTNGYEAGSAFTTRPVDVSGFTTQFVLRLDDAQADGMAFVIQGQGATALGEPGGGLGDSGITPGATLKFDLYDNDGEGANSTGLFTGGAFPSQPGSVDLSATPIDLHSGDPILVRLTYDGALLSVTLTDTVKNQSASQSYPLDLPGLLGSRQGYVGFTGGTGGLAVRSNVLSWTFATVAPAAPPTAPTGLTAAVVDVLTAGLNWTDPPHATGYEVQRMIAPGGAFATVAALGPNASSYQDPGLSTGTRYVYRVRASNAAGASDWSNQFGVDTPRLAATPRDPRVTGKTDRRIAFAWDDVSDNETGFRIFRKVTTAGTFQYLTTVPADTSSYTDTGLKPGTVYDYHIQAVNLAGYSDFAGVSTTTLPPSLPAPWSDADVGTPAIAGAAEYAGGVYTLTASGQDIWNNADAFHFQSQPLRGDGTITARVVSLTDTDPWAKAGVMIRQSLDAGSPHALLAVTPGNGVAFQHRDQPDSGSLHEGGPAATAPEWVRLARVGNRFTASSSADGVTWTDAGTLDIPMGSVVYAGLALTSHNDNAVNTAAFDHVSFRQADYSAGLAVAAGSAASVGPFLSDRWYEGAGGTLGVAAPIDRSHVRNPAPEAVYQSERLGDSVYVLPDLKPGGLYTVRLHEAELTDTVAGARRFDVAVNGTTAFTGVDVFATAGGKDVALVLSADARADALGQITVALTGGPGGPAQLSGLEVVPRHAASTVVVAASAPATTYGRAVAFTARVATAEAGLPAPTGPVDFLVDGRKRTSAALRPDGTASSGPIADLDAGPHTITVVYAGDGLYAAGTSTASRLTVAPAPLTLTADNASKVYGSRDPAFTASASGFVLGQGLADLKGRLTLAASTATGHVGAFPIVAGGLTSTNYAVAFRPGTLTVTPAPLTVIARDATGRAGSPLPPLSAGYIGLVGADTADSLRPRVRLTTTATRASLPGRYAVVAGGAGSPDYRITYVPGTLTLLPRSSPATHRLPGPAAARGLVVSSLYRDILGRAPAARSLIRWSAALARGLSTDRLARRVWASPEHGSLVQHHAAPGVPLNVAVLAANAAARGVRLDDPSPPTARAKPHP